MKTLHIALLAIVCLTVATFLPVKPAQAARNLGGYPVILVHGFQPEDLFHCPTSWGEIQQNARNYWPSKWRNHGSYFVSWSSCRSLINNAVLRDSLRLQTIQIYLSGLCDRGCIFVTHSTGALMARYMLHNQKQWIKDYVGGPVPGGKNPLKVITVLDFAGADGGTELADWAIQAIRYANTLDQDTVYKIKRWLRYFTNYPTYGFLKTEGVLFDLRPGNARWLDAQLGNTDIPHLRFVGGGTNLSGLATSALIKGRDDAVVPLHSACGSAFPAAYESCDGEVNVDGALSGYMYGDSWDAPSAYDLWPNYYPVLMGARTDHTDTIGPNRSQVALALTPLFTAGNHVEVPGSSQFLRFNFPYANPTVFDSPYSGSAGSTSYSIVRDSQWFSMTRIVMAAFNGKTCTADVMTCHR